MISGIQPIKCQNCGATDRELWQVADDIYHQILDLCGPCADLLEAEEALRD